MRLAVELRSERERQETMTPLARSILLSSIGRRATLLTIPSSSKHGTVGAGQGTAEYVHRRSSENVSTNERC